VLEEQALEILGRKYQEIKSKKSSSKLKEALEDDEIKALTDEVIDQVIDELGLNFDKQKLKNINMIGEEY